MDEISAKYGLVGIFIMLTIQVLLKVAEFAWGQQEKKQSSSEAKVLKLENDLKRAFYAIKILAGHKWSEIREDFTKEFPF